MRRLAWIAVGIAGTALVGCGPEETTSLGCGDPALLGVDEECGVWVSASLGSDDNPGTPAAPMASLSAAVLKADGRQNRVYACGELWTEPLVLPSGVSLFGGFDCKDDWRHGGKDHRSAIETGPGEVPLRTEGELGHMEVADFRFQSADAAEPGGSSIAVMVTDDDVVQFRRCTLFAGRGADGLDGERLDELAATGATGNSGANACSAPEGAGGEPIETDCGPGAISQGGKGGAGGLTLATDGEAGLPPPPGEKDPSSPDDGDGGKGQTDSTACTNGEQGDNGADGEPADEVPGAQRLGSVSRDGFKGTDGEDGKPGAPGQGGGGGGGSRGSVACGAATPGGAGGGSGGGGGCGGKGGKGGKAGGSSFAILILGEASQVRFEACDLQVSKGGDGGDGAPGQPGGNSGKPGLGGAAPFPLEPGCHGGYGGYGGDGSPGRGGNGGHSVFIAYQSFSSLGIWSNTTFEGEPLAGKGGESPWGILRGLPGDQSAPPHNLTIGFQE